MVDMKEEEEEEEEVRNMHSHKILSIFFF